MLRRGCGDVLANRGGDTRLIQDYLGFVGNNRRSITISFSGLILSHPGKRSF
jgi:hypothetical protein